MRGLFFDSINSIVGKQGNSVGLYYLLLHNIVFVSSNLRRWL